MYGQKPDLDNRWKVLRLFDIESKYLQNVIETFII
jgi:hypothetical protein